MGLRLGVDRTEITPDGPIALAGFASRAGLAPASKVLAPLRLRTFAFALESDDDGPERRRAVLVCADLLWWGSDTAARVRRALAEAYGLADAAVVLHATHTHSGPQTSFEHLPSLGIADPAYVEWLIAVTVASVGRALASPTDVRLDIATTQADLGVDRRSARTAGAVSPSGLDNELTTLRFVNPATGSTLAVLAHYACHPVVHHGNAVTSDFAGATADRLETLHPGAVCAYLQGCAGDVNPALYDPAGRFHDGGQDVVTALGTRLADAASGSLGPERDAVKALVTQGLAYDCETLELPLARLPTTAELRRRTAEPDPIGAWARLLLARPERRTSTAPVRLSRLALGPSLLFVGLSGEPVSSYALQTRRIARETGRTILPLGYTGGIAGYLVTARQLAEGGYEPDESTVYFGLPAPFSPAAEGVLRDALDRAATEPVGGGL